jgi:hypothetical protein
MKELIGPYIPERITVIEPNIYLKVDISEGAGWTAQWPFVAIPSWIEAPGFGIDAINRLAVELQRFSDRRQKPILDLSEIKQNTPAANSLFRHLSDIGIYQVDWFGNERCYWREFLPNTVPYILNESHRK